MFARAVTPILEVTHLRIERGPHVILHDVSWRVQRGQHWIILGPNGCGKTSLLKALTAYMTPTRGTIDLLGRRFGQSDWRTLRTHVGLVTSAVHHLIPPAEPAIETIISGRYAQLDLWGKISRADRACARRILRMIGAAHRGDGPTLVLVTHHLEEIMPAFSHVLLMKAGRILAAGPRREVLTAHLLGAAFGARARLAIRGRRWQAWFTPHRRKVF